MNIRRYQWVGLLAGFPLFSGAWLAAYYSNQLWMAIGAIIATVSFYLAVKVERRSDAVDHILQGATAGVLAAIVARGLSVLFYEAIDKANNVPTLSSGLNVLPNDLARIIIGGTFRETILLVFLSASVGVIASLFEPRARRSHVAAKPSATAKKATSSKPVKTTKTKPSKVNKTKRKKS